MPHRHNDEPGLSHIGPDGRARMVDVGGKPVTERGAVAAASVRVNAQLADAIRKDALSKGDLLQIARLAGIQAAKHTSDLIPLCHPIGLTGVDVDASLVEREVRIRAEARTAGQTGVEMEALAAVTVAALTVIDMGKSIDKGMVIEGVRLVEKWGGRSGHYRAPECET